MLERLLGYGLQYSGYALELALFLYLLIGGKWRRLAGPWLYVGCVLLLDGIGRPYVLYRYGLASHEYAYFFWLSDVLLGLAAFGVTCALFRRACAREAKMWQHLRLLLGTVFALVLGISALSLSQNLPQIFTGFIVEFQQNLYFTCLVLNTLLYLLVQRVRPEDEELNLLVAGLGIQFAGPAACLALVQLTGPQFAPIVFSYVWPLCTVMMLLTWFYGVALAPKPAAAPAMARRDWARFARAETH
jgi:hypothetical protein